MNTRIDLEEIPFDDNKTFRMLSKGHNLGVFQLGEGWVKSVLRKIQPDTFDDLVAINALLRPGALDSGGPDVYAERKASGSRRPEIHPELDSDLEPILAETYGILLYQEQVLAAIKLVTGWGYAEADLIFNAMRKKNVEKLAKAKPGFFAASRYSQEATEALWATIEPFADYSFNKAHAVAYAYMSYKTAYLKANYPTEFIAALMTHESDQAKIRTYIKEANVLGIRVLPPDINESNRGFTPTPAGIRYGLSAIKDVGDVVVDGILEKRPFHSISDLYWTADQKMLSTRVLRALSESGALDSIVSNREGFADDADTTARLASGIRRKAVFGERPLFLFNLGSECGVSEVDYQERGRAEAERLGIQLTHPRIVLQVPQGLTQSQAAWMNAILTSREPLSEVLMVSGGFRVPLGIRSSYKGLQSALKSIDVEVTLE